MLDSKVPENQYYHSKVQSPDKLQDCSRRFQTFIHVVTYQSIELVIFLFTLILHKFVGDGDNLPLSFCRAG